MKEAIEKKLKEHLERVLKKDYLLADDLNFLVYMLGRIEAAENKKILDEEAKKRNEEFREKMRGILEGV